jgi:hypothetical protein
LNPHGGEAARFSKPARRAVSGYLPYSVDPPRIELGFPPRQGGVVPLDHEPISFSGPAGESNPDLLVAGQASSRWTSRPCSVRGPSGNRTRPSALPRRCAAAAPTDQKSEHYSDPGWNRTITFLDVGQVSSPLDHGIKLSVTEVGVEPTKSRGSRPRRFASLRTRPISSGSGGRTRRAELMRLGWALAHPRQ